MPHNNSSSDLNSPMSSSGHEHDIRIQPLQFAQREHLIERLSSYLISVRQENSVQLLLEELTEIYLAAEELFCAKKVACMDSPAMKNDRERSWNLSRKEKNLQILIGIDRVIQQGPQADWSCVAHSVDALVSHLAIDAWSRNRPPRQ